MEEVIAEKVERIARDLSRKLESIEFDKSLTVYDPTTYGWNNYSAFCSMAYVRKGVSLMLGMNPGPFGMVQLGVPFGNIDYVSGYLGIDGDVEKPIVENSVRKIEGRNTKRKEVSGQRFWEMALKIGRKEDFFSIATIHTFCPLAFIDEKGRNITPVELEKNSRQALEEVCLESLIEIVSVLKPSRIIAIGQYAEKMARRTGLDVVLFPHPSPRNPSSSAFWPEQAAIKLRSLHDQD